MVAVLVSMFILPRFWPNEEGDQLSYTEFIALVRAGDVTSVTINNSTNRITGELDNGDAFFTTGGGDRGISDVDEELLKANNVDYDFRTPVSNPLWSWLGLLLPFVLLIGFFVWMQRRAAGQMGNVMSIGRSRAKAYTTDKPSTTFAVC